MSPNHLATRVSRVRGPGRLPSCCATAAWSAAAPIPYAKRVLGDTRTTSVADDLARPGRLAAARRHQRRRLQLLRRLPAQAAARAGPGAATARPRRQRHSRPALHRVHRRLQHLLLPGVLRARNRHHPHAAGRHARLRSLHARHRRSRALARADRLLQLRRSLPAQARRRDVRVHQDEVPAHLPLHQHQRPGLHRREGPAARALGHR